MKKLILASASVLAIGIAGSGFGYAAEPTSSSTNLPASSAQTQRAIPQNTQAQTAPVNASETEESHFTLAQNAPTPAAIIASTAMSKSDIEAGPGSRV